MVEFFKKFGKGILYILVLPAFLIVLVAFGIYGLVAFLILLVKSIILFFSGRSLYADLPEDKKAKEILKGLSNNIVSQPETSVQNNETPVNNNPFMNDNQNYDDLNINESINNDGGNNNE